MSSAPHQRAEGADDQAGGSAGDDGVQHRKTGRRRIFAGIGASGLAAAVAVFGRSGPAAAAYAYACCSLEFHPTMSVSACKSGSHYVWHCWHAGYVRCQCCEAKDSYGHTVASAYSCQ
ncbi:hypothetical protein I0C86_28310 [Plantactinospora sp. S1510]|uniref:Uncharacterized protein n=1 Tax=Plantactinospora alkalitolerans TaxID=2789879 RepID=A0ABS0H2Z3_9ACTN|nr:hypothetical protein [Plantactinospora alkalitolerans]MBF9132831.1 hypothetical protein [Plantactinospora alkalitolerans]